MGSFVKISNSQIISLQKCEQRFYFEHVLKIRPNQMPEPMQRGTDGHTMLEAFFKCMQDGGTHEQCMNAVNDVLLQFIGTPSAAIYRHVIAFGTYVWNQPWKVVSVEESILHPIDDIQFAFTADLVVEWTEGLKKGQQFILDFKFTGQYWTDRELSVYQQLPKYIIYTNEAKGTKIRHAALVMLNTRAAVSATGNNLFMVKWVDISKPKLARLKLENEILIQRVKNLREIGEVDGNSDRFMRTADTYACKMCPFADDLCPMLLNDKDITKSIKRNYTHNTYFEENYGNEAVNK
jgi:hypothetical protein